MTHFALNELSVFLVFSAVLVISIAPAASVRFPCTDPAAARFMPSMDADENGVGVTLGTGEHVEPLQFTAMAPTDSAVALPPGPLAVWFCAPSLRTTDVALGPSETVTETVSPGLTVIPLPIDDPLISMSGR
jgi:hypothetical protein